MVGCVVALYTVATVAFGRSAFFAGECVALVSGCLVVDDLGATVFVVGEWVGLVSGPLLVDVLGASVFLAGEWVGLVSGSLMVDVFGATVFFAGDSVDLVSGCLLVDVLGASVSDRFTAVDIQATGVVVGDFGPGFDASGFCVPGLFGVVVVGRCVVMAVSVLSASGLDVSVARGFSVKQMKGRGRPHSALSQTCLLMYTQPRELLPASCGFHISHLVPLNISPVVHSHSLEDWFSL